MHTRRMRSHAQITHSCIAAHFSSFFAVFCLMRRCRAALFAIEDYYLDTGKPRLPLIISGTITDASGRTLSGQTTEAFYISVAHAKPFCIGLNCALGATDMRPYLQRLGQIAECFVHAYPNAGLPNAMGGYDETAADLGTSLRDFAVSGLINMAGGCCGTTPPHIKAIAQACEGVRPREPQPISTVTRLSGLEPLILTKNITFVNIGERCNIAGSRAFKNMIMKGEYEKALAVARSQVENGAQILDYNFDEGLLDGEMAMKVSQQRNRGENKQKKQNGVCTVALI